MSRSLIVKPWLGSIDQSSSRDDYTSEPEHSPATLSDLQNRDGTCAQV